MICGGANYLDETADRLWNYRNVTNDSNGEFTPMKYRESIVVISRRYFKSTLC
jgi:hypothetical protein